MPDHSGRCGQARELVGRHNLLDRVAGWVTGCAAGPGVTTGQTAGDDQPLQAIPAAVELPLEMLDWRERADAPAALQALAQAQLQRGFALDEAPLLRLHLVRLGAEHYHCLFTHHHILLDGWSTARLLGEVLQAYAGETPQPAAGAYRDYIRRTSAFVPRKPRA